MSCKFNGKISAEFTPPKTWVLEKALSFTVKGHGISSVDLDILQEIGANVANTGRVTCKKGMKRILLQFLVYVGHCLRHGMLQELQ